MFRYTMKLQITEPLHMNNQTADKLASMMLYFYLSDQIGDGKPLTEHLNKRLNDLEVLTLKDKELVKDKLKEKLHVILEDLVD